MKEEQHWDLSHEETSQLASAVQYTKAINSSGQSMITSIDSALQQVLCSLFHKALNISSSWTQEAQVIQSLLEDLNGWF